MQWVWQKVVPECLDSESSEVVQSVVLTMLQALKRSLWREGLPAALVPRLPVPAESLEQPSLAAEPQRPTDRPSVR